MGCGECRTKKMNKNKIAACLYAIALGLAIGGLLLACCI